MVITASSHLDPSCTYTAGFEIATSGVTLDCLNALVQTPGTPGGVGILIHTPVDVALTDVTVRSCQVDGGWTNSLKVTRDGFRTLPDDHEFETRPPTSSSRTAASAISRGVGVYVDGYVSGVSILRSTVYKAGLQRDLPGDRLQADPRRGQLILDQTASSRTAPAASSSASAGINFWFWGARPRGHLGRRLLREHHRRQRVLRELRRRALPLQELRRVPRPQPGSLLRAAGPVDDNLIEGNVFVGGRNGVWVGSRMGENILPMECSDPAYVDTALKESSSTRRATTRSGATTSSTSPTASGSRTTAPWSRATTSPRRRPTTTR